MTATTKLALELLANAAANQVLANTTFAQLNQIVQAGAVDRINTPPGSPANEALYIITATATGAWAGKENQLAYWLSASSAWTYIVPREGFFVHVDDEDDYYKFDGSAWGVFSGGGMTNPMTTAGDIIIGGVAGAPSRLAASTNGYVLTLSGGSPVWAAPAGGASLSVVATFTGNKTLALADINTYNVSQDGTAQAVTIPAQATVAWTADAELHIEQGGAGAVTVTGATGVTVNGVSAGSVVLANQLSVVTLKRTASNTWTVIGGLSNSLVSGPVSAGDGNLALYNGTTGKQIKDGGTVTAAGLALLDDVSASAQRTTLGVGTGDSPTFTAVTLSNGQLVFPATQVASAGANTLDDYEEGTYTPVWSSSGTAVALGNGTITGIYTKVGRSVTAGIVLTMGSTTTFGTGEYYFTLPFTASAAGFLGVSRANDAGSRAYAGICQAFNTTQVRSVGDVGAGANWGQLVPHTWAVNDIFESQLTYFV